MVDKPHPHGAFYYRVIAPWPPIEDFKLKWGRRSQEALKNPSLIPCLMEDMVFSIMKSALLKSKTIFICQNCGSQSSKWLGRCPDCEQWNSFVEELKTDPRRSEKDGFFALTTEQAIEITKIPLEQKSRLATHISEFDRVLGGGLVPGSLVLLGGDPGIGKSTLILEALDHLAKAGHQVLYATGEESKEQVKLRGERLGVASPIWVIAENSLDQIIHHVQKLNPEVLVVDSIQTVYLPALESAPGSISQVRESAGKLLYLSKSTGIATILIGHVTKEGALAGPRILEHMVDCVLYFEGDTRQHYRILRTMKNRFGSTNEIGVFEMSAQGLLPVENPSSVFLSERLIPHPGSTVCASLEGVRPFLVELEALVSSSFLTNPRRTTQGVDSNRLAILIAVLEKVMGLNLYNQDVYVNAAGGFRVVEPAADLAILGALVSSFKNQPLLKDTVLMGEVGLNGDVRGVQGLDVRIKEAEKMGFKRCIIPKNKKNFGDFLKMELCSVSSVSEALEILF